MEIKQTDLTNEQPPDEGPHFARERGHLLVSVTTGGGMEFLCMWGAATLLLVFVGLPAIGAAFAGLAVPTAYKSPRLSKKLVESVRRRIRR